ncbi:MAG TPA: hypothetical protein ENI20_17790 [Bacteroides sp.]|nr:hypothetical protein [Bacteroides sp.]
MKQCIYILLLLPLIFSSCEDKNEEPLPKDPNTAEAVTVDRFSDEAAVLMKRSANTSLPGANEPVNFDTEGFLTTSFGPEGQVVQYYNFDVQPTTPAPIYVLFKEGEDTPVGGQLNIIDVIPGDEGYNDFWQVYKVTVPADYQANVITSYSDVYDSGYGIEKTMTLVNCPVVSEGSTASKRLGDESNAIQRGWYKDKIAYYFAFEEKALTVTPAGTVPLSPIYVTFNKNPDPMDPTSGPPSGFVTEPESEQTHNVIETIPSDDDYSPLWVVYVYDNADFDNVSDLVSAKAATILIQAAMNVNCPTVYVEQ